MKPMRTASVTLFAAVAAAVLVSGCSSVKLDEKPPVETAKPAEPPAAPPPPAPQSQVTSVDLTKTQPSPIANVPHTVYFDFDSFVVKDDARPTIDAYAKYLGDRAKKLTIEGHTDERGGREYNLALGQKRAEAVAKSLTLLGATDAQIESVSFGKERPAAQGNDEAAWAKNRRAELVNR